MKWISLLILIFLLSCENQPERKLLEDRPQMQFPGAEELLRISEEMGGKWNPAVTQYKAQTDFEKGIMLREDLSTEVAWECYFFEIHNMKNRDQFLEIYRRGVKGEFTREEWVRENAWIEYCSAKETAEFSEKVLVPIFLKHNLSLEPIKVRKRFSERPFEELMKAPQSNWPWNYWGNYYDTYLNEKK